MRISAAAAAHPTLRSPDDDDDLCVPLDFAHRIASAPKRPDPHRPAVGVGLSVDAAVGAAPSIDNHDSLYSITHSLQLPISPENDDQVYDVPDIDISTKAKARWEQHLQTASSLVFTASRAHMCLPTSKAMLAVTQHRANAVLGAFKYSFLLTSLKGKLVKGIATLAQDKAHLGCIVWQVNQKG